MPPKKKVPKKKENKNPENGGELDAETKAKMFMLTCQSLQVQLGNSNLNHHCETILYTVLTPVCANISGENRGIQQGFGYEERAPRESTSYFQRLRRGTEANIRNYTRYDSPI